MQRLVVTTGTRQAALPLQKLVIFRPPTHVLGEKPKNWRAGVDTMSYSPSLKRTWRRRGGLSKSSQ